MNIKHVEYLVTVAQTHSISKASALLGVSQPNISLAVKSVEKSWGIKIFTRTNRGVILTKAGEKVIGEIEAVLRASQELKSVLQEARDLYTITVGTNCLIRLQEIKSIFEKGEKSNYTVNLVDLSERERLDETVFESEGLDFLVLYQKSEGVNNLASEMLEEVSLGRIEGGTPEILYYYLKSRGMTTMTVKFLKAIYESMKK